MRLVMLALLVVSCRTRFDVTCSDVEPCPDGQTCIDGVCDDATCNSSLQCPMETYCDQRDCIPGCQYDSDCYSGDACVDGDCEALGCIDTITDCAYREWCEAGECVDAGDPYCMPCDTDADCGDGNLCWLDAYCGVDCSNGQPCPAAFDCLGVETDEGVVMQCLTQCWLFL